MPSPPPVDRRAPLAVAVLLALAVYWLLAPLWPELTTHLLGDAETDAIRGMWSFDHVRRSMIPPDTPIWSDQINVPGGVTALALPWVSAVLLAPLGGLVGPLVGWNLGLAVLLWAAGFGAAALGREVSGSWAAGAAAGGVVLAQPMLLHAIGDGTPEHLAIWSMPLFLAAAHRALRLQAPRWGIAAGLLAAVIALDSPYHAIYTALIGALALPWAALGGLRRPERRLALAWTLGCMILVGGLSAGLIGALYQTFELSSSSSSDDSAARLLAMNAADLRTWWLHDFKDAAVREASLAPTVIPAAMLWGCLALAVVGLPRSLPWTLTGMLLLCLSLGLNSRMPTQLTYWIGDAGTEVGRVVLEINRRLCVLPGLDRIRFPQRWLVPSALCFAVGASAGLGRLARLPYARRAAPALAVVLVAGAALSGLRSSRLDIGFFSQPIIAVDFATWLRDQPGGGAVIHLPQMRPPPPSGLRTDLPVFANLDDALTSADTLYFQILHGRPMTGYPNLKTIKAEAPSPAIIKLFRDWDDLTLPETSGRGIPPSASDPRAEGTRSAAIRELYVKGLRWVAIDLGAYNDEALGILRDQIGLWAAEERTFEQGDGVLVIRLAARASATAD